VVVGPDNVCTGLEGLGSLPLPLLVWVRFDHPFTPCPLGRGDRPPEEMSPHPERMLQEMWVAPVCIEEET
jgi:hypothetical protein